MVALGFAGALVAQDGDVELLRPDKQKPGAHPTLAGALIAVGVTPDKIDHVRLVGDEASGTSGKTRRMNIDAAFWKKYFEGAKLNEKFAASGYRKLEVYLKGEAKPKTTIHINELDTCLVDGDPFKMRYLSIGLHDWFSANLQP